VSFSDGPTGKTHETELVLVELLEERAKQPNMPFKIRHASNEKLVIEYLLGHTD
jgi:hypothetical protein